MQLLSFCHIIVNCSDTRLRIFFFCIHFSGQQQYQNNGPFRVGSSRGETYIFVSSWDCIFSAKSGSGIQKRHFAVMQICYCKEGNIF